MASSPRTLTLDADKFDPCSIPAETHSFNERVREATSKAPKWYEIGAPEARRLRHEGKGALPGPVLLPSAEAMEVPSRDAGRMIPCRVFKPRKHAPGSPRAMFMHIHGGGWVFGDEMGQDTMLQGMADKHGIICLSVGYRLAPEHPFPAGPQDCFDVAEWLVDNAEAQFGAPFSFIGGESAGAHLSVLTILQMLRYEKLAHIRDFRLRGALLHFGCYTLAFSPSAYAVGTRPDVAVLNMESMEHFREAFLPGFTEDTLRDPNVSPLYANIDDLRGRLPPALFTCGTMDCLMDDTLLMSARWVAAGAEARLEIVPGAVHGYIAFPRTIPESGSEQGMAAVDDFVSEKL